MTPEALLTVLVQARKQVQPGTNVLFVIQTNDTALPSLVHPMLPGGGLLISTELRNGLRTLVQWGYLSQPEQNHGTVYLVTPAGLNYAARLNGSWDGVERRRQDRRAGGRRQVQRPVTSDQRGTDRRQVERRTS